MASLVGSPSKQVLFLPLPRPSVDHGRVQLNLGHGGGGKASCGSLTAQQNERVAALERSLSKPASSCGVPTASSSSRTAELHARRAEEAATEARNRSFAAALCKVEEMMASMECAGGAPKPEAGSGGGSRRSASGDDDQMRGLTPKQEAQREAAQRLFEGSSGASTALGRRLPARAHSLPPAKAVEHRLKLLRADPARRQALAEQVTLFEAEKAAKRQELSRGKDFVAINVLKAARPRSAPVLLAAETPSWAPPLSPTPLAERPAFRPGGAPAYRRPGSAPPGPAAARGAAHRRDAPTLSSPLVSHGSAHATSTGALTPTPDAREAPEALRAARPASAAAPAAGGGAAVPAPMAAPSLSPRDVA